MLRSSDGTCQCRESLVLPANQDRARAQCKRRCEILFLMQRPSQVHNQPQLLGKWLNCLLRSAAMAATFTKRRSVYPGLG